MDASICNISFDEVLKNGCISATPRNLPRTEIWRHFGGVHLVGTICEQYSQARQIRHKPPSASRLGSELTIIPRPRKHTRYSEELLPCLALLDCRRIGMFRDKSIANLMVDGTQRRNSLSQLHLFLGCFVSHKDRLLLVILHLNRCEASQLELVV